MIPSTPTEIAARSESLIESARRAGDILRESTSLEAFAELPELFTRSGIASAHLPTFYLAIDTGSDPLEVFGDALRAWRSEPAISDAMAECIRCLLHRIGKPAACASIRYLPNTQPAIHVLSSFGDPIALKMALDMQEPGQLLQWIQEDEDHSRHSPMLCAAFRGRTSACELLAERGHPLDTPLDWDPQRTPLYYALLAKHASTCSALARLGARLDLIGENEYRSTTPECAAAVEAERERRTLWSSIAAPNLGASKATL